MDSMSTVLNLKAEILINGINPYVLVKAEDSSKLIPDWRRPMPVLVQVNGRPTDPWHINMMPMGDGNFYLYLHGDMRKTSNTRVGDIVDVSIWFDRGYRNGPQHTMPVKLKKSLTENAEAENNWFKLSPSRQKEVLRYLANIKSDDVRDRNIERVMYVLSGEPDHFMGRDWVDGK